MEESNRKWGAHGQVAQSSPCQGLWWKCSCLVSALLLPHSWAWTSGSTVSSWHVGISRAQPGTTHGSGLLLLLDLHYLLCIFRGLLNLWECLAADIRPLPGLGPPGWPPCCYWWFCVHTETDGILRLWGYWFGSFSSAALESQPREGCLHLEVILDLPEPFAEALKICSSSDTLPVGRDGPLAWWTSGLHSCISASGSNSRTWLSQS